MNATDLFVPLGYLLGSVESAILVGRLLGLGDPRARGSHNPGATNMLRLGGRKAGALTLLGDMLKGLLAVALARAFDAPPLVQAGTALAAFLGHLYPLYFGFKGGKGVATALGCLLGLDPLVGLATAGTWLLVALVSRISSLSALVAVLLAPGFMYWHRAPRPLVVATAIMTLLMYWRHRSNIRHLLAGTEGRIGERDD